MGNTLYTDIPSNLLDAIELQEGLRLESYWDPIGNCWTIGYGHTGPDVFKGQVVTQERAALWLDSDIQDAANEVNLHWPDLRKTIGDVRWSSIVNQVFNMGIGNVLDFGEEFAAIARSDWKGTVLAMRDSLWYNQVPNRVNSLAYPIMFDTWVVGYLNSVQLERLNKAIS